MNHRRLKWFSLMMALVTVLTVSACHKKVAPAPPPPPPPPAPAPTASLTASPATIQQGQSTTLTWTTQNATDVSIDGIGAVIASGSRTVGPTESTTYHLVAKGDGGTQEATARVTVTSPPAPESQLPSATDAQLFASSVRDVYFDYDSDQISPSQQATMQADATFFKGHPNLRFTVEGHCDERGSTEYNLALGENRANAVKQALVNLGVPGDSIKTISFGKEKPACNEHTEQCWQQNRRGHFVLGQP